MRWLRSNGHSTREESCEPQNVEPLMADMEHGRFCVAKPHAPTQHEAARVALRVHIGVRTHLCLEKELTATRDRFLVLAFA